MNYNLHQLPVDSANDIVSFMDNDTMFAVLSAYRPLLRNQFLLANQDTTFIDCIMEKFLGNQQESLALNELDNEFKLCMSIMFDADSYYMLIKHTDELNARYQRLKSKHNLPKCHWKGEFINTCKSKDVEVSKKQFKAFKVRQLQQLLFVLMYSLKKNDFETFNWCISILPKRIYLSKYVVAEIILPSVVDLNNGELDNTTDTRVSNGCTRPTVTNENTCANRWKNIPIWFKNEIEIDDIKLVHSKITELERKTHYSKNKKHAMRLHMNWYKQLRHDRPDIFYELLGSKQEMLDFLAPYNNMPQWVVFVLWSEDGLNGAKYFTSTEDVYNTSNRLFYNSCNHEPSEFQDLLTIFFKCLENCVEIANAWSNILACHKQMGINAFECYWKCIALVNDNVNYDLDTLYKMEKGLLTELLDVNQKPCAETRDICLRLLNLRDYMFRRMPLGTKIRVVEHAVYEIKDDDVNLMSLVKRVFLDLPDITMLDKLPVFKYLPCHEIWTDIYEQLWKHYRDNNNCCIPYWLVPKMALVLGSFDFLFEDDIFPLLSHESIFNIIKGIDADILVANDYDVRLFRKFIVVRPKHYINYFPVFDKVVQTMIKRKQMGLLELLNEYELYARQIFAYYILPYIRNRSWDTNLEKSLKQQMLDARKMCMEANVAQLLVQDIAKIYL